MQGGDPLSVRRQFKNIVAAIVRRNRINPRARLFLEIGFAQETAVLLHEDIDLVRDLAFVKNVAPFLADQSQRFCQRWVLENVAFRRRLPFAVERVGFEECAWKSFIEPRTECPIVRDQLSDWKTFFGITNRRGEIVGEFQFAEFLVEFGPRINRSRHADRQHPLWRNRLAIQFVERGSHLLVTQAERRTPAPVHAVKFVLLRDVNNRKQIAANSV